MTEPAMVIQDGSYRGPSRLRPMEHIPLIVTDERSYPWVRWPLWFVHCRRNGHQYASVMTVQRGQLVSNVCQYELEQTQYQQCRICTAQRTVVRTEFTPIEFGEK